MSAVSPSPITPTTPSVPGLNLSGGGSTFATSGVPACPSSTAWDCSGPWMIETQRMDIQYVRVPIYSASSTTFNLTSPAANYKVAYTFLQSLVTAQYRVEKVYEDFNTSAFQQPQTFEWFAASSDSYGNTYGEVGASALGPAGNVQTMQQWYNRKPWDQYGEGTDVEVLKTMTGLKHRQAKREFQGSLSQILYRGGLEDFGDFKTTRWSIYANTFLADSEFYVTGDHDYFLNGQYITTKENPANIVNYINGLGTDVTNINYYQPDAAENPDLPRDRGFAAYSTSRHGFI